MEYSQENNKRICKSYAEKIERCVGNRRKTIYDFFDDNDYYDIEYRIDQKGEYKSVEVAIGLGGPNVYIDTRHKAVRLFWSNDYAEHYLSDSACNAVDDYFEEKYNAEIA
jgi:hypothetical protein